MPRLGPATPEGKPSGLGCCAFARHYLRNRVCFLLLEVLRCFTSLGVALPGLSLFIPERHPVKDAGFPHSEISGSKPFGGSPELIAALCVLHRLMMPRHPSHARIRLARDSRYLVTLQFSLTSSNRFSRIDARLSGRSPLGRNGGVIYQIGPPGARGRTKDFSTFSGMRRTRSGSGSGARKVSLYEHVPGKNAQGRRRTAPPRPKTET